MCRAHEMVLVLSLDNAFIMLEGIVGNVQKFLLVWFRELIACDPVE